MLPFEKYQIRFGDAAHALHEYRIIDVRSPGEFAEDRLPGAVNLPVLNDPERAQVGTLYKESQFEARELGARLISANISRILEEIGALHRGERKPFLIYCWRGGMRSRSLFTVMHLIGYPSMLLAGGYQAYRRAVQTALYEQPLRVRLIVIHGYTGSGKTAALVRFKKEGTAVLDLEWAANHRGSLLGRLPGGQPSQKDFESRIYAQLPDGGSVLVEGESRKIGKLSIPPSVWTAMDAGIHIWVDVPLEARAQQCVRDYGNDLESLRKGLSYIEGLSGKVMQLIRDHLEAGQLAEAARLLLVEYYDPLYRRHSPAMRPERYAARIEAVSSERVGQVLRDKISEMETSWMRQR